MSPVNPISEMVRDFKYGEEESEEKKIDRINAKLERSVRWN